MNLVAGRSGPVKLVSTESTPYWGIGYLLAPPVFGRGRQGLELLASRCNLLFNFYFKVLMMVSSRN